MPDRRRQIQLLISSRFDLLWFPGGALRTTQGLAPTKRVPCPSCGAGERPGWLLEKRGGVIVRQKPCAVCGGVSGDKPKGGKGVVAVDPMDSTRSVVGSQDTHASARPRKTVKCDACQDAGGKPTGVIRNEPCPHCEGTGRRDLHVFDLRLDLREDGDADPIDVAIDRRDDAGSYHALDLALAGISRHANKPLPFLALTLNATLARRLLDDVFLLQERQLHELAVFEQSLVELALAYIDSRMPDPIVVPRDVTQNARERTQAPKANGHVLTGVALHRRDKEIRNLVLTKHLGVQYVARQYGISPSQVNRICAVKPAQERVA